MVIGLGAETANAPIKMIIFYLRYLMALSPAILSLFNKYFITLQNSHAITFKKTFVCGCAYYPWNYFWRHRYLAVICFSNFIG